MKRFRIQHFSEKVFVSEGRKTMRTLIMGTISKARIQLTLRRKELVYIQRVSQNYDTILPGIPS